MRKFIACSPLTYGLVLVFLWIAKPAYTAEIFHAMELAAEQQALAQETAKTYIYIHHKIFVSGTKREQGAALKKYKINRLQLKSMGISKEFPDSFVLIDYIGDDFLHYVRDNKAATKQALAEVIELSEALTEAYGDLLRKFESKGGQKSFVYAETIDRQPMQIERMAKYYVAYLRALTTSTPWKPCGIRLRSSTKTWRT